MLKGKVRVGDKVKVPKAYLPDHADKDYYHPIAYVVDNHYIIIFVYNGWSSNISKHKAALDQYIKNLKTIPQGWGFWNVSVESLVSYKGYLSLSEQ